MSKYLLFEFLFLFFGDDKKDSALSVKIRNFCILGDNFERLKFLASQIDKFKICFIGQPGAGKSSLILKLTSGQCFPLPEVGIETDVTDWTKPSKNEFGISYNDWIIYDTPGYSTDKHPVAIYLEAFPFSVMDLTVLVIKGKMHEADEKIIHKLESLKVPYLVVRSFSENLSEEDLNEIKNELLEKAQNCLNTNIYLISNRTSKGVNHLKQIIKKIA